MHFPALVVVFALPAILRAGVCSADDRQPRHDFQFLAGYSPASATLIGTATAWNSLAVSYTAAAMPAAILIQPYEMKVTRPRARYMAVAPVGFTFALARKRRVHPFVETAGGIVASTEPIPENQPDASGLNFFFDLGGGVRWRVGERGAVSLGYRFLHVSNAGTTSFDPGVDNNVFYVGYSSLR